MGGMIMDSRFLEEVILVAFGGGLNVEEEGKEGQTGGRADTLPPYFQLGERVEGSTTN